jgi:hypothetical protein
VNSRGIKVGNDTYGVNITVFDIGGSYATAYNVTEAINRGDYGNFDFLFGMCMKRKVKNLETVAAKNNHTTVFLYRTLWI